MQLEKKQTFRNRICNILSFHQTLCRWRNFQISEDNKFKCLIVEDHPRLTDCNEIRITQQLFSRACSIGSGRRRNRILKFFRVSLDNLVQDNYLQFPKIKNRSEKKKRSFQQKNRNIKHQKNQKRNLQLEGQQSKRKYNCARDFSPQRTHG